MPKYTKITSKDMLDHMRDVNLLQESLRNTGNDALSLEKIKAPSYNSSEVNEVINDKIGEAVTQKITEVVSVARYVGEVLDGFSSYIENNMDM